MTIRNTNLGYPYYTNADNADSLMSEIVETYSTAVAFGIMIGLLTKATPAFAVDTVSKAATNTTELGVAGAILGMAIDTAACQKTSTCLTKAVDYLKEGSKTNPKIAVIIGCTIASTWCAKAVFDNTIRKGVLG